MSSKVDKVIKGPAAPDLAILIGAIVAAILLIVGGAAAWLVWEINPIQIVAILIVIAFVVFVTRGCWMGMTAFRMVMVGYSIAAIIFVSGIWYVWGVVITFITSSTTWPAILTFMLVEGGLLSLGFYLSRSTESPAFSIKGLWEERNIFAFWALLGSWLFSAYFHFRFWMLGAILGIFVWFATSCAKPLKSTVGKVFWFVAAIAFLVYAIWNGYGSNISNLSSTISVLYGAFGSNWWHILATGSAYFAAPWFVHLCAMLVLDLLFNFTTTIARITHNIKVRFDWWTSLDLRVKK